MLAASMAEIKQLRTAERIQLVEDIWDTISAHPEDIRLSEAQTQELDRRLVSYEQNPQMGASWKQVRQRVRGQT